MAIDRDATLKNAESFLRVGRLDAAIEEYARVVADQPKDWNSTNALGDLYVQAGQSERAVPLYGRVADHFLKEGFYPKAAALFKKILKIRPGDEAAQLRLAEIAVNQGLTADAKAYYSAVERRRRRAGDAAGADEILVRVGELELNELAARLPSAGARAADDHISTAAERSRQLADAARQMSDELLKQGQDEDAAMCAEKAADALVGAGSYAGAAALLAEFAARVPSHVPTLLKLVEVCVDGGLEEMMFDAQAQLADAYLAKGSAADARVIAEDLVGRAPGDPAHLDRLRRALIALEVDDVEGVLAEHALLAEGRNDQGLDEAEVVPPSPAAAPEKMMTAPAARPQVSPASVEVDLTGLLGALEGQTPARERLAQPVQDLEEVFAGLRAEVENLDEDDSGGDHLELARTYLAMGMSREAIASLETAARAPRHRFAAASLLADIHRDEGDLRAAIDWCGRAAEVPAPEPERGRVLLYELGDLLETVGETARALAVFLELAADTPDYRDVRERVARLSRLETEG